MNRKETMSLGENIRRIRNQKGLSQENVSDVMGPKREYLSKIENGHLANPTYFTLLNIAKGLEVEITELVDLSIHG